MAARRQAKKGTTIVGEQRSLLGVKSVSELKAEAPKHYWSTHYIVGHDDYVAALNAKHRFFTLDGFPLNTEADVRDAIGRYGNVESYE